MNVTNIQQHSSMEECKPENIYKAMQVKITQTQANATKMQVAAYQKYTSTGHIIKYGSETTQVTPANIPTTVCNSKPMNQHKHTHTHTYACVYMRKITDSSPNAQFKLHAGEQMTKCNWKQQVVHQCAKSLSTANMTPSFKYTETITTSQKSKHIQVEARQ
jgi:hypothetical protein